MPFKWDVEIGPVFNQDFEAYLAKYDLLKTSALGSSEEIDRVKEDAPFLDQFTSEICLMRDNLSSVDIDKLPTGSRPNIRIFSLGSWIAYVFVSEPNRAFFSCMFHKDDLTAGKLLAVKRNAEQKAEDAA